MKTILTLLLLFCFGCKNEQQKAVVNQPNTIIVDTTINIPMQQRQYINTEEIKGWDFEKIKQKYKPIQENNFLLNKGHISEFRVGLYNIFRGKDRQKPIPIKEATWEKDSLTNYTIWFKKDTTWKAIDSLTWSKEKVF